MRRLSHISISLDVSIQAKSLNSLEPWHGRVAQYWAIEGCLISVWQASKELVTQ